MPDESRSETSPAARSAAFLLAIGLCLGLVIYLGRSASTYRGPAGGAGRAAPDGARAAGAPNYHAVVIGIGDYAARAGGGWENLKTARADAEAMAEVLRLQYGFSVDLLTGPRASKSGILTALDKLATLDDRDAVLIYYAGHGSYDEALDEGFWIPCDARKTADGRDAREDWIWNSMITKMINASRARHVLVIADSCYAGSLFRGGEPAAERAAAWYARALDQPSRYLVASGDLEPVLDSGFEHSVFAEALLQFLRNPNSPVFSASDMALAVREKVGALTGQRVRIGPLAVSSHGGGEFVFSTDPALLAFGEAPAAARGAEPDSDVQAARDALWLDREGATNSAARLLAEAAPEPGSLTAAVSDHLHRGRRQERQAALRQLIEQVRAAPPAAAPADRVMPRVIACLGPEPLGEDAAGANMAALVRIGLTAALQRQDRIITVERENLEAALQELNLGFSSLADPQARLQVGRFLPASTLLLGHVARQGDGWTALLRLVDTETSRILESWSVALDEAALPAACTDLAQQVAAALVALRPDDTPRPAGEKGP